MIQFAGRLFLLDLEGTLAPLAFVQEVLFPYARQRLPDFLAAQGGDEAVRAALDQVARDAGGRDFVSWCPHAWPSAAARERLVGHLGKLMDRDAKETGLKQLQGIIWTGGYRDGTLRVPVFADVPPRLRAWRDAGRAIWTYSSGSVAAQRLFLGHTDAGDLTPWFSRHFDTATGPKRDPASYREITAAAALAPGEVLFLSDVTEELDAARIAGLATGLVIRPGNRPAPDHGHPRLGSFAEVSLA
ncbi:MAG: acireductone synthase [Limisphaerales bacterium]